MTIRDVTDYSGLLTSQYASKPKAVATVEASVSVAAYLQAMEFFVQCMYDVDYAIGVQLDVIGEWAGISRRIPVPIAGVYFTWDGTMPEEGWGESAWRGRFGASSAITEYPDDEYRRLIKAKIVANNGDGSIQMIYDIFEAAFPGADVLVIDNQDMTITINYLYPDFTPMQRAIIDGGFLPIKISGVGINYVPSYDRDAEAIIAAMDTPPDNTRAALITDTVIELKAEGIWDKADSIFFRAAADSQAARLDWKRLQTGLISGSFVTDSGIQGAADAAGYSPGVNGVNYTQDSACIATMISGHTTGNGLIIELQPGGPNGYSSLYYGVGAGNSSWEINSNAFPGESATIADPNGLWIMQRTGANTAELYRDNVMVDSSTIASDSAPAGNFMYYPAGDSSALQVFGYSGAPLDSTERAALQTIVNNYLAGL